MLSDNSLTLAEVRRKIDFHIRSLYELRGIENRQINAALSVDNASEIKLTFDDETRTIEWFGGSLKLSPQRYRLLSVLWNSPEHQINFTDFESAVWQDADSFTKLNTVKSAVDRTNRFLWKNHCPYQIYRNKNESTQEISGFVLHCLK